MDAQYLYSLFGTFMMPLHQNVKSCLSHLWYPSTDLKQQQSNYRKRDREWEIEKERLGNVVAIVTIWRVGKVSPLHSFHHIEPLSLVLSPNLSSHFCLSLSSSQSLLALQLSLSPHLHLVQLTLSSFQAACLLPFLPLLLSLAWVFDANAEWSFHHFLFGSVSIFITCPNRPIC